VGELLEAPADLVVGHGLDEHRVEGVPGDLAVVGVALPADAQTQS